MEIVSISRGEGGGGEGCGIFYNRMKFCCNPFSLSKVMESSSWFSYIHSTPTVCKMKNKARFEIRAMTKCVLFQYFWKEKKVVQLSHPPCSPDLSPCDFSYFLH